MIGSHFVHDFIALVMKHYTCDTWCCGSTVHLLVGSRLNEHVTWLICNDCSRFLSTASHQEYRLADLLSMTYPIFLPNHPEKHPIATPCFSMAAAAAPPSASHPQRPRLDGAAWGGSERPRSRGRAADLCGGHGGRDQQRRSWPRKGFRVVLGVALTSWWNGFVHWQVILVLWFGTCCLRIHFLWWDGPLEIRVKRNEMKRVESRRNHVVSKCSLDLFFWRFCAWSHIFLWNCDRRMVLVWNNFWQQSCQIFSLPAVECSDFIFVAGMYPEIEKKEN